MEGEAALLERVAKIIVRMMVHVESNDHEQKHGSSNSHSNPTNYIAFVSRQYKQDSRIDERQQVQDGCVQQALLAELVLVLDLLIFL